MRAVVANTSTLSPLACAVVCAVACLACELTPSPVGKSCKDDSDCNDSSTGAPAAAHHCELALAQPICLPGLASVTPPKNRAPIAVSTTIVALTGSTVDGTLGIADPEGGSYTIVDDNGAPFAGGVVQLDGGTALLTIENARTGAFELVAGDSGFVETQRITVSDGVNTAAVPIAVAVVDASSASVSSGGEWSDGAAWSTGVPPIATSTAFVDGAMHVIGAAASAARVFGTARASLAVDPNGIALAGAAPVYFHAGGVSGDGQVSIASGALLAGAAPTVGLVSGAHVVGAFDVGAIDHASGGELVVDEGASLVVAGAALLPTLTLSSGAFVEVDDRLEAAELKPDTAPAGDRERTVVARGDVSVATIRDGAWRLIVDGAKPQTMHLAGALDAVEIRPAADVSFAGVTHVNDMLLEGGVSVDKDVVVDTLHIRRIPRALAGSRTIHADVCDVPADVDVALPSYIACAAQK